MFLFEIWQWNKKYWLKLFFVEEEIIFNGIGFCNERQPAEVISQCNLRKLPHIDLNPWKCMLVSQPFNKSESPLRNYCRREKLLQKGEWSWWYDTNNTTTTMKLFLNITNTALHLLVLLLLLPSADIRKLSVQMMSKKRVYLLPKPQ